MNENKMMELEHHHSSAPNEPRDVGNVHHICQHWKQGGNEPVW